MIGRRFVIGIFLVFVIYILIGFVVDFIVIGRVFISVFLFVVCGMNIVCIFFFFIICYGVINSSSYKSIVCNLL